MWRLTSPTVMKPLVPVPRTIVSGMLFSRASFTAPGVALGAETDMAAAAASRGRRSRGVGGASSTSSFRWRVFQYSPFLYAVAIERQYRHVLL
eukprot:2082389-Prymnesium_polylepis.1